MIRLRRFHYVRHDLHLRRERLLIAIALRLPKRLRYWVTVLSMVGDSRGHPYDYPGDKTSAEVLKSIESWNGR